MVNFDEGHPVRLIFAFVGIDAPAGTPAMEVGAAEVDQARVALPPVVVGLGGGLGGEQVERHAFKKASAPAS